MSRKRDPKNKIIDCGCYYKICLNSKKGKEVGRAKIDKNKLDEVKQYGWCLSSKGYVIACINNKTRTLHQVVLGKKKGFVIDHKNTDRLDNRKINLRYATHSQNQMNKPCKGVYFEKNKKKKWLAHIGLNGIKVWRKSFYKKSDATNARRKAEKKFFKKFAYNYE